MGSIRNKAFTVVEVVVAIGVIVIFAGISYSVYGTTRSRAESTVTIDALRQTYVALELYRQNMGGELAETGTSSEMGLPNRDQFYFFGLREGIKWWQAPGKQAYGPIWYPLDPSDTINADQKQTWLRDWKAYVTSEQGNAVLVGDFNHTEGCGHLPDWHCMFDGYGITLNGTLRHQSGVGNIHSFEWWEQ